MSAAPAIDEGDPGGVSEIWRLAVWPTAGRLGNSLRVLVLVLLAVAIGETLRLPEIALSAYVVLFVSRGEAASTVLGAVLAGVAVVVAITLTIGVFMVSLGEPALRIPLIAAITFVAMLLSRVTGALGPLFMASGFIVAYGLTLGDETLGLALQPGSVANTADFTLPELAFIPPEEALLQFVLWLALVVGMPLLLVIVANLATGRDPAAVLRAALAARLAAAARFCEGAAGAAGAARTLAGLAGGTAELLKLQHLAGVLHRGGAAAPVREVQRLLVLLQALGRIGGGEAWRTRAPEVARFCREAAAGGATVAVPELALDGAAAPLGGMIGRTLRAIRAVPEHAAAAERVDARAALRDPSHARFALKVSLAVMICYVLQSALDWPGIHTCVITCYFVSLATVGETVHKATLRLAGCLVGGALGIGAILLVMPGITDLGGLLLLLAPVTFMAAWIGFGSERIAYAGWQIALAFYLSVLQGFGPTLDMATARDRIVGILLGNLVIFLIFSTVWPVSAASVARAALVRAARHMAALLRDGRGEDLAGFEADVAQARAVMVSEPFEAASVRGRGFDARVLSAVRALVVPVTVVLELRHEAEDEMRRATAVHQAALADWFERAALWVDSGAGAAEIARSLPQPPVAGDAALTAWYGVLHQDLVAILRQVGTTAPLLPAGEARLAPV